MKIIEIVVAPDGKTRVETKGFTGEGCREASRLIEQALGKPQSEQLTNEFHEQATVTYLAQEENGW